MLVVHDAMDRLGFACHDSRMKTQIISLFVLFVLAMLSPLPGAAGKPNIILIMADDLGYEAIAANGGESAKTPNLDRLAAEGMRFTNAFANPLCTPSRVKIMTGLYNVRNYTRFGELDRGQITFAHQLKQVGYATGICGKWQLGKEPDAPQHFGFDDALLWQHTGYRHRQVGSEKKIDTRYVNPCLQHNGEDQLFDNGEYGPQLMTDFACQFIAEHKDSPFLLYYPMILTHCPFDPTPDSTDWDPRRPGSTTYKGDLNDPQRYFVDMVQYADKIVGQIVAQLEQSGIRDNTLILFTGDNGTDKPIVTPWNGQMIPGGKKTMTDAGTRVPLIVNWPAGITQPGTVTDALMDFADVLPTVCDVAGAPLPDDYPGDGKSLVPLFEGRPDARNKEYVYIWHGGEVIIRNQKYMLLANKDGSDARLQRYAGAYDGEEVSSPSESEQVIMDRFQGILESMGKTRRSAIGEGNKGATK